MKRILAVLLLLSPLAALAEDQKELFGFAVADVQKDVCMNCGDWAAAVAKYGSHEAARTECKKMDAQFAAYKAAKAEGDLKAAAILSPFKSVEAWMLNNLAHRICEELSDGLDKAVAAAPKGQKAKGRDDYCASVNARAEEGLAFLASAKKVLEEASSCATASKTSEQVEDSIAMCKEKVASNENFLSCVTGKRAWDQK